MTPMALDVRTTSLVGRDIELDELASITGVRRAPSEASEGSEASGAAPQHVVLGGDAGVGKSRLLRALREQAREAGWRDIVGHCLDFGDSALPYLPFTEIIGRLVGEAPDLVGPVVAAHPALARLLPGQRLRSGEAPVSDGHLGGDRAAEVTSNRTQLFEGVRACFEALGSQAPLLVIIEDAHWADQASRELVTFLLTREFTHPVALVVSFRSDDVHRRHPLRTTVAEWARIPGVTRVQLAPLADDSVRALVAALHPAPLRQEDLRTIVARADGNPFFTEELVSAAQEGGHALPDDLAELLLVRLDRLDESTRSVVRAASAAGRRVSHELLSRVIRLVSASGSLSVDALDLALRQAVDSHVLLPSREDSYAFRHALLAEAVYDDLLPGERVRLHAAYVTVLRSGEVPSTAAELARHARAARDLPTAVSASIEAGDEAMEVGAPEEAARHYQLALELVARPGGTSSDGQPLLAASGGSGDTGGSGDDVDDDPVVTLAIKASSALAASGDPARGLKLLLAHLAELPPDSATRTPLVRARLLIGIVGQLFLTESDVDGLAMTREAMLLVPDEPSRLRAAVLSAHAKATTYRVGNDQGARFAMAALDMARSLRLPMVAAEAETTLAKIDDNTGDLDAALARLGDVIARARADHDINAELRAMHLMGNLNYTTGAFPAALETYAAADRRARETGRPWGPYGLDARALAAHTAYLTGSWDEALRLADTTGQAPPPVPEATLAAVRLCVLAGRGEPSDDLVAATRPAWERDGMVATMAAGATIDLHGDAHDVERAVADHDEVMATLARLWPGERIWVQIRLSALVLGQLASHAPRIATGDLVRFGASGTRFVEAGADVWDRFDLDVPNRLEARAWRDRAIAEHHRLRWLTGLDAPTEAALVDAWRRAVASFEDFGHVFEIARSQARLAAVLRAVGEVDEARALGAAARGTARRLGAEPLLLELRGLGGATARSASTDPAPAALTGREREILVLVAQGRSNADIGRLLFISGKTVSVHVSNVMAKLGAGGRTEAVALARRSGLLAD